MKDKLFCSPVSRRAINQTVRSLLFAIVVCVLAWAPQAKAGSDAPSWLHALTSAPLPAHDEKTDAILLYSERTVTVVSVDKVKTHVREAYKILRPDGREHGTVFVPFNVPGQKVTGLHGWCIPAQGRDYEVKDKDAVEMAPPIENGELVTDTRYKVLRIPAPDPGNVIGYEYEVEEQPLLLQDVWGFQGPDPVQDSRYSLVLPAGWKYKASWFNHSEVKADEAGGNTWQWALNNIGEIRREEDMPPIPGVAGHMVISYFPPGGPGMRGFATWGEMGNWYTNLTSGRRDASPEIQQKVAALTASATNPVTKMQLLAQFVQHDIRYVAIELGIGGFQPHAASDVFVHKYGDCKDKATLMGAMLHEIGIDSYYVVINSERGAVTDATPVNAFGFDHAIIAIKLPAGVNDPSLIATVLHPRLGRLLFFDPTNDITPFGQIGGYLQANWGLLVTPEGGELVELPKQPAAMNSIRRTAKLSLDLSGALKGEVREQRLGDRARHERRRMTTVTKDTDRIKPIESLLADSMATFRITKATVINLDRTDQPLGFDYSFEASSYAKNAGGLLLLRPRVVGSKTSGVMETKEPRKFPYEFSGPTLDTDTFEITLPEGYVVDDLPPAVDADYGFASYHSKSEASGNVIRYTRSFEVKELSVPVSKAEELKKFYRIIATDERNTAVLKPAGQ